MHTLYPLLRTSARKRCDFVEYRDFMPDQAHNKAAVFVRVARTVQKEEFHDMLHRSRQKFDRLNYFDDGDGAECYEPTILRLVDTYWKKQVFTNKQLYLDGLQATRFYYRYYNTAKSKVADGPGSPISQEDLDKISLAWNIGIGSYPLSRTRDRMVRRTMKYVSPRLGRHLMARPSASGSSLSKRRNAVSARFAWEGRNDITGKHRRAFVDALKDDEHFLLGLVSSTEYDRELSSVRAVFSPFGYGEVCFRDFETAYAGATLIKPEMGHIQTWPDIFEPHVTYQPVRWDGSDIVSQSMQVLEDHQFADHLVNNAQNRLAVAYETLDTVANRFVDQCVHRGVWQ